MNFAQAFYNVMFGGAQSGRGRSSGARRGYTGAELRDIRKRKGIGRPPERRGNAEA